MKLIADERVYVPAAVLFIQYAVDGVTDKERCGAPDDPFECELVVDLCVLLFLGQYVLILDLDLERKHAIRSHNAYVDGLGDFPCFDKQTDTLSSHDHDARVGAVIDKV